jgi:isochorismate synthase
MALVRSARSADRPLVARQILETDNNNTEIASALEARPEPHTFAWIDRDRPIDLVASGAVCVREGMTLATALDDCLDVAEQRGMSDLPLWVGGAAFEPGSVPDGAWSGWPAAALWVPRFMRVDRDRRTFLVSHVLVSSAESAAALDTRLQQERRNAQRWLDDLARPPRCVAPAPAPRPDETADAWRARVSAAIAALRQRRAAKVVLARAADVVESGLDVGATLHALCASHPHAFCFAVRPSAPGSFVGATPELLVRRTGGELVSEALAGTVARGQPEDLTETAAAWLLASGKDRHEHALVLQHVLETLRGLGAEVVHDATPEVVDAGRVLHLRSRATATRSADRSLLEVVAALHPTPAVGGVPVEAAAALRRDEPLVRGWYAAPIGWLDANGDGVFAVALRSALIGPAGARLFAGAGIVEESDPEAEWQETELKLQAVRDALRVATPERQA